MKVLDLFSGICGFGLAFQRAGFEHLAFCEQDSDCQRVIRRHFPNVEIINDVKEINKERYAFVPDVICGGFPCQDVSVAGKRAGLAGERSGLWFEFRRIIESYQPRWVVIENVPGLLSGCGCESCQVVSRIVRIHGWLRKRRKINKPCAVCNAGIRMLKSHSGRNLAIVLQGLAQCGYRWAYRVLDSQFDGVAQRRRRVFIVAGLGAAGERAAEILFEREGGCWNSPPRRETGQDVAGTVTGGAASGSSHGKKSGTDREGFLTVGAISSKWAKGTGGPSGDECQNLIVATLNSGGNNGGFRTEPGEHLIGTYGLTGHGQYVKGLTTLRAKGGDCSGGSEHLIAHTLSANGADASEDGTGRGTPLVAQTITAHQFRSNGATAGNNGKPVNLQIVPFDTTQITSKENGSRPQAYDPCHPLAAGAHAPAIAFTERTRADGRNFEAQEELAYALTDASKGGNPHSGKIFVPINSSRELIQSLLQQGFSRIMAAYANATKTNTNQILQLLQRAISSQEDAQWLARELASFQPQKVLQSGMHGSGVQGEVQGEPTASTGPLSSQNAETESCLRELRDNGKAPRRSPRRRKSAQQRSGEPDCSLPLLPSEESQQSDCLCDLWRSAQGTRLLQQALDTLSEIWRSTGVQDSITQAMCGMPKACECQGALRETLHEGEKRGATASLTISQESKGEWGVSCAYGVRRLTPL